MHSAQHAQRLPSPAQANAEGVFFSCPSFLALYPLKGSIATLKMALTLKTQSTLAHSPLALLITFGSMFFME